MVLAQTLKSKLGSLFLSVVICSNAGISLSQAQGQGPAPGEDVSQLAEHIFDLEYKPSGFNLNVPVRPSFEEALFEKQPDFGQRNVVRGLIPTGTDEKDHTGFMWDRSEGKLYLDLNRNRDLTDDPNGVFESASTGPYQSFRNIRLQAPLDSVRLPFMLEMSIYDYGQGQPTCYVNVLSGFSGEIDLRGKKWYIAIADNMDGKLGRGDHFVLTPLGLNFGSRADQPSLPVCKTIFFGEHDYDVSFDFQPGETKPLLRATFREIVRPMGKLDIEGRLIYRLVLQTGSSLALLDSPEANVSIPAASYHCRSVYLDGGESGLFRAIYDGSPVSISENESTRLKIGGPLSNTVEVQRMAGSLTLNYKLIGVGGNTYESLRGRSEKPPTFAIYKADEEIAAGEFEYG